ncbi:hypothetical protein [Pseudomonas putida]|uniref:hypothetical protein n=1 Tax=Pseudomonas putida TaxID=303 RepID=UPI0023657A8B|nr:hypothetical protein [Pseudomonas putida]MDD2046306.1 hypothetical protein [Pseudomonas putida]
MIENLSRRYTTEIITTPKKTKRLNRYISGINKALKTNLVSNDWLARKLWRAHNITDSDVIICNDWQFRRSFQPTLIKNFKGKKVLLVRNVVEPEFMHSIEGFFDKVYSFDKQQCEALGMDYLHQFFPYGVDDAERLYSQLALPGSVAKCFFLGRDKGRTAAIESIAQKLRDANCIVDFHIVKDNDTQDVSEYHIDDGLSYAENIERSINASMLADINKEGQNGITLRVLEAIFFNKKLITSNTEIKSHDFYRPENIFVIGQDNFDDLEKFINTETVALPREILHQYGPDYMLDKITADINSAAT